MRVDPYHDCTVARGRLTIPRGAWNRPGFRPADLFARAGLDFVDGAWTATLSGAAYTYTGKTADNMRAAA